MVYNEIVDVPSQTSKGSFVTHPFCLWNKKGEKDKQHEKTAYHKPAVDKAVLFGHSIEKPQSTIVAQIHLCKAENIKRNRQVLMSSASAILFCA